MCIYCNYRVYTLCSVARVLKTSGALAKLGGGRLVRQARKDTDSVEIIISNSSNRPIYEQITSQIKAQILDGTLAEGQQLPSIRALASDLRVSAITTKRAYADLETQGYIETVQGKGSFVAGGNAELLREERLREVEEWLGKAIEAGRAISLTNAELTEMLSTLMESDD